MSAPRPGHVSRRSAAGLRPEQPAPPRGPGPAAPLRPAPRSARPASPAAGREWRPDPPRAPARGPPTADGCGVAVPRTRRRVAPLRPARGSGGGARPGSARRTARRRCGGSRSRPRAAPRLGAFPARQRVPRRREARPGPGLQLPACPAVPTSGSRRAPRPCRRRVRDAAVLAEQRRSPPGRAAPLAQRRALGGSRRSGGAGFRPPLPAAPSPRAGGEAPCDDIGALKEKDRALDREIAQLLSEGYSVEELEKHISLLHEYNEIKDAGQMLLGKLAVIRGVTTKQLYPEYDLELND